MVYRLKAYCVNKIPQSDGCNVVHVWNCPFIPTFEDRIPLGLFRECRDAVIEAKKLFGKVIECNYCCLEKK